MTHTLYTVENAQEAQNVNVALTKDTTHNFSADLIVHTDYFGEQHTGERVSYSDINGGTWEGNFTGDKVSWVFGTQWGAEHKGKYDPSQANLLWLMNVLQINGTDITVPFTNGIPEETTLPSGTKITVTRTLKGDTREDREWVWGGGFIGLGDCILY